jgi:hypothetical protein
MKVHNIGAKQNADAGISVLISIAFAASACAATENYSAQYSNSGDQHLYHAAGHGFATNGTEWVR